MPLEVLTRASSADELPVWVVLAVFAVFGVVVLACWSMTGWVIFRAVQRFRAAPENGLMTSSAWVLVAAFATAAVSPPVLMGLGFVTGPTVTAAIFLVVFLVLVALVTTAFVLTLREPDVRRRRHPRG